jgi:hypothetical protein
MALSLGLAVAAAPVKLAEVVDGEARDLHGAAAVVLKNLVLSAESAAAGDGGGVAGFLLLDGEGVLADGRPPDVGQLAGAHAVHAFDLVGADDDVGERGAGLWAVSFVVPAMEGSWLKPIVSNRYFDSRLVSSQQEISTHLKNKHSIAVTTLRLASAVLATVVDKHATIEALAGSNSLHSIESRSSGRGRDAATGRAA